MGAEDLRVEDRILVHLHHYIRYADDYEVPKAMSQRGIGEAVWIAWSNVPRAMKRLKEDELVDERTTRVRGEFRKKKVYSLTPKGFARATELMEEQDGRKVTVRMAGEGHPMTFGEVPTFVGHSVPYLELLRGIDEDGVLDVERAQARWEEQVEMVDRTERAPKPRVFVGREEELEALRAMVDGQRVVVIHGIAGIGKSYLASKLVEELRRSTNALWVPLHTWDTLSGVLEVLSSFLKDAGRGQTRSLLDAQPSAGLSEVYYPLEEDLRDLKGVIVLDDFHKARPEIVDLASMLLELLQDRPSPAVLLISRHQPSFYDRRYVVVSKVVAELHLEGLDRASARTLLEGRGLSDSQFEEVYTTTQGHPLALELIAQGGRGPEAGLRDAMAFVRQEVFEGLATEERRTLETLCVHRGDVPREAALAAASASGGGPEVIDELAERGLVTDVGDEEVHLHDLVREFFYSRLDPMARHAAHMQAAEVWGRLGGARATIERAHHLMRGDEQEAAVAILADEGQRMLMEPHLLRDVVVLLDEAEASAALPPPALDEADLLRADALASMGQADAAMATYTRVMDRAVADGDEGQEARVLHRVGQLHSRRGQYDDAQQVQGRALALFESLDDEVGAAHCRLALADVLLQLEEAGAAEEHLVHAMESFSIVEENKGIAKACLTLASIKLDEESASVARSYVQEAMDNIDPKEDLSSASLANYYMGEVNRLEEDWEGAAGFYEAALELFQAVGDDTMVANACNFLGDAYMALGDEERANLYYQRGMDLMVAQ